MKRISVGFWMVLLCGTMLLGQQQVSTANTLVPRLVRFSGTMKDAAGKPLKSVAGVTFALYKDQAEGAALWIETQNVQPDASGHYTVLLGASKPDGLPSDIFIGGEARWLAVQVQGQEEQPRVLLVAVPYALKAGDADTVGGLPASAFMLATPLQSASSAQSSSALNLSSLNVPPLGGSGTTNYIPIWTNSTTLGDSMIYQTGGNVGIGNTHPAGTLDVSGGAFIRGTLQLPATGTATATLGFNSQPLDALASAFSSSTHGAINQHFRWQAEPVGNDTASPSGKLNLLFASGTATPAETGLSISNKGIITFAPGQTMPTVTGNEMVKGNLSATGSVSGASANFTGNVSTGKQTVTGNITDTGNISATGSISGSSASFSGNTANQIVTVTQNGTGDGLVATAKSTGVKGSGAATGVLGSGGTGVVGDGIGAGVVGSSSSTGPGSLGVQGVSVSSRGIGVFGFEPTLSNTANSLFGNVVTGVWGDVNQGSNTGEGILATADDTVAILGQNNSTGLPTAMFQNVTTNSLGFVFLAKGIAGNECAILVDGELDCTGTKSAVVPVEHGRKMVALYALEAPENWFEDFGSGRLVNGSATVALEATYAQTVNTRTQYHVFITPKGDCNGLYVTNETAASFEVRELHGGHSSIAFDYRIVAKRTGYEQLRLADKTGMIKEIAMMAGSRERTNPDTAPQQIAPRQPR